MGMLPFRCCCGGAWDFFAWANSAVADVSAARVLARATSSLLSGDQQTSYPGWSVDIADFNGPSGAVDVHFTHGNTNPAGGTDQRVWYFLSKDDPPGSGDYRIEVVDYSLNGTPTNSATYTVDWDGFWPNISGGKRDRAISWDSIWRQSATYVLPNVNFISLTSCNVAGASNQVDLSDGTELLWNEFIEVPPSPTNADQENTAYDRYAYLSADYRPHAVARYNADQALGYKLTVDCPDVTWEYDDDVYDDWGVQSHPTISTYELKVVLGDLTDTSENSTVAEDTVLYTLTGKTLAVAGASGPGVQTSTTEYEVESVSCVDLEVVGSTPLGIFLYTDEAPGFVRAYRETHGAYFPFFPAPVDGDEHDNPAFWWDLSTGVTPGTVKRIDMLLPNGTIQSTGLTSVTSGDVPKMARLALGSSGAPNGNFFLITNTNGGGTQQAGAGKLKYMSDATTEIWSQTFDLIEFDMEVSNRFVYVIGRISSGGNLRGYAFDYSGNYYELQWPNNPFLPLPDFNGGFSSDYYVELWAVCRFADRWYPTAEFLADQEP